MASYNKTISMGNLTRDPELTYTQGGTALCKFPLAMNEKFKDKDGNIKEDVCFVDITVWGKHAENCNKYLSKGSLVQVDGKLKLDTWTDKEGQKRSRHGITANSVQFLPSGGNNQEKKTEPRQEEKRVTQSNEPPFPSDDEIPF